MDGDGPGEGGVHRLHLLQELEHADGGEGDPEVGPAGEVQLGDQPGGLGAVVTLLHTGATDRCYNGLVLQQTGVTGVTVVTPVYWCYCCNTTVL